MVGKFQLGGRRLLHTTQTLSKAKDANKQALRNLGLALQKDITKDHEQSQIEEQNHQDFKKTYKKLQSYYDSISHMPTEDLLIQQNFDEGKQFKSFPSEHYLDRKDLIRNLPDEIDIFKTPLSKIEKIYKDLGKLDEDRSVQLKYYKRYLRNYSDPIVRIIQEFNGINDKFKLLRRNEIDKLYLSTNSSLFKDNLFGLPYNVIGFDRSISGFPLRLGRDKPTDISYPPEFIQDLQQCSPNIKIHKKDLDFIEYNKDSISIDPNDLLSPNNLKYSKVMNLIYNELDVPKKFLLVDDVNDYKVLKFKFLNKYNSIVETEINTLKSSLQKEIELILSSNNEANNLLLFNHQFFKTNSFKLCDFLKDDDKNTKRNANMLIISYNVKEFNLIPYNYLLDKSRRSKRHFYNHLFKLFLINLQDQIETLNRIKYSKRKEVFRKNLNTKISNIIKYKLFDLLDRVNHLKVLNAADAICFKPFTTRNYKRLYNYNKVRASTHRRSGTQFNLTDLEDILHRH